MIFKVSVGGVSFLRGFYQNNISHLKDIGNDFQDYAWFLLITVAFQVRDFWGSFY